MRLAITVLLTCTLSSPLWPLCAFAQPDDDPGSGQPDAQVPGDDRADDAARRAEQAKVIFEDAGRFVAEGKYEEALQRYRIAYELSPRPKILLNIATLLLEIGREVEAANTFARYLSLSDVRPEREEKVTRLLADLDARLSRLQIRIAAPAGTVHLDEVALDANADEPFTATLRVQPGTHTLVVERPGQPPERRKVTVAEGAVANLVVRALETVEATAPSVEPEPVPEPVPVPAAGPPNLHAFVRVDFDVVQVGLVGAPGVAVRIAGDLQGYGNALLGRSQGGELGVRWEPGWQRMRLRASLSIPLFYEEGPRVGARAAVGVVTGGTIRAAAEIGLVHHLSVPSDRYSRTVVLAALAVEAGL